MRMTIRRTLLAVASAALLPLAAGAAAPAATPSAPPTARVAIAPDGRPARQTVAIPDVCAWPNLAIAPDGKTIYATLFNRPSHGRLIGGIDCYASTDGGASWTKRATAAPPDPGAMQTRMNHAAGLTASGALVVIAGGWTLRPEPNENGPYQVDKLMRPYVSRSTDGGRTWTIDRTAFPESAPTGETFVPFGAIATASDGGLRVSAYVVGGKAYVLRSDDDGRTWRDPVEIPTALRPNETTLWSDGHGRMLAAARTRTLEVFESTDDGKTWAHLARASDDLGVPGDVRRLADGRLLVTHGNRRKGGEGVDARVSADGGKTWSVPARLANFVGYDGGYPSSVQRPDGMVVTAFYAKKLADRDGYHMGTVIWDPAKTFAGAETARFAPAPATPPAPTATSPDDPAPVLRQFEMASSARLVQYMLTPPARETPEQDRWLVIYFYGAGGSMQKCNITREPYRELREALAAHGAYVAVPELGPQHFMNARAREIVTALIERVTTEQGIDPRRVHLMGTSMGGESALAYTINEPARVRSVTAVMPITDVAAWARESRKYAPRLAAAYGGTPAEVPAAYDANSAVAHVDALAHIPVFLVHGDADRTVPPSHSRKLADLMTAKGYTCTLRTVPGGTHADAVVNGLGPDIFKFMMAAGRDDK